MGRAERAKPAKIMYAGAFMWLLIVTLVLLQLILRFREELARSWMDERRGSKEPLLKRSERNYTGYGTLSAQGRNSRITKKVSVDLYAATVKIMFLLWIAQWLFWGGFIGLSSGEYVFIHMLGAY